MGFFGVVWFRGGFKKFCHFFRYPRPSDTFDNTFSPFLKSQIIEKAKNFLVSVVILQIFSTPFLFVSRLIFNNEWFFVF